MSEFDPFLVLALVAILAFQAPFFAKALKLPIVVGEILFGVVVAAYKNIRQGLWADALMDQLPWLMLVPGIIVYGLIPSGTISKDYLLASKVAIGLGVAIL